MVNKVKALQLKYTEDKGKSYNSLSTEEKLKLS